MPNANVNGIDVHYRETGEGFPVVFVHGYTGNSRALTVPALREQFLEPSRQIHEAIPGSELVIIQGAGPQMETPAEFNRVLAEFLSRVRQTAAA